MKKLLSFALILPLACASPKTPSPLSMPVWVTSHNDRAVDVYLLCGRRDAMWLGVVDARGKGRLEFPSARARCVAGLNLFLVPRAHDRGYWVGPLHPQCADSPVAVELVIEKYAALSTARLRRDLP
jgi:hypothetical protein